MLSAPEFSYDAASAMGLGARDQQQDELATDFAVGSDMGFAVLADGMGGHASGEVASKIVVTEVFSELKLKSGDPGTLERHIGSVLREAAKCANECVRVEADSSPHNHGMGATLVAPVLVRNRLYWISVGDSPLYLFRNGRLTRLNEDHSLVPQIEMMVEKGLLTPEDAAVHPDRNCLTSVLIGRTIPKVDCPNVPVALMDGDIIVVASDGLAFLRDDQIEAVLRARASRSPSEICATLMHTLERLNDPDQDNVALCVVKVRRNLQNSRPQAPSDRVVTRPLHQPVVQMVGSAVRRMAGGGDGTP